MKTSDHSLMIISLGREVEQYGPSPFRCQGMWCNHEDFISHVKVVWNMLERSNGLVKLATKLKRTKISLRALNKNTFE